MTQSELKLLDVYEPPEIIEEKDQTIKGIRAIYELHNVTFVSQFIFHNIQSHNWEYIEYITTSESKDSIHYRIKSIKEIGYVYKNKDLLLPEGTLQDYKNYLTPLETILTTHIPDSHQYYLQ